MFRALAALGFSFRLLFAFLTILIGGWIVLWVLYNHFIERLPGYSGGTWPILTPGTIMVTTGILWLRRLRRASPAPPPAAARSSHSSSRPVKCRWCGFRMIADTSGPDFLCEKCGSPNTGYHTAG
ncbi:MAG TPA: hypothetical protein VG796_26785 [Verrucomicrobiales bacterium]|nr:hypothetical protein [Verrucomicrobiales bacterium]